MARKHGRKRVRPAPAAEVKKEEEEQQPPPPPLVLPLEVLPAIPSSNEASLMLEISKPEPEEECGIGMESIAAYRLEWIPPEVKQCVWPEMPELTKAMIVNCKHAFNALALLYHFAKNEMTCPFCRGGFSRKRMSSLSIPSHLKNAMLEHLHSGANQDGRDRERENMLNAQTLLEREVNIRDFLITNRQVLILYAYMGMDSSAPLLVQEVQLESSISSQGVLRFSSFTHSMRELNRNLRLLPPAMACHCFEAVVGTRAAFGGPLALVKSHRFTIPPEPLGGVTVVPCVTTQEDGGQLVRLEVRSDPANHGLSAVCLTMPGYLLHTLAVLSSIPTFHAVTSIGPEGLMRLG